MKRFLSLIAAAAMLCACSDSDREHTLKVYNWSTYIDETLIGEFEQWYEEQTGEPVHVIYQTFDVLETMLSKIEKGHEDYDVVCPSDYIIERMLQQDLCIPLDRNFGDTPDYTANVSPFIRSWFDVMRGGGKNANDYSVGYMWGTTGILYNPKYVSDEEASTWDVLRNPKFTDKIFVKDSPRDVCSQIVLYLKQKELAEGTVTMDELMLDSSEETLSQIESYMKDVRNYIAGWEADFGKEQMIQERGWVNLNWSGDSEWAIEEAAESGLELRFINPKEGFTIFFDGWVIPKYARNIKAANYWINFLCRQDIAVRNADEIGYVPCIGGDEVLDYFTDDSFDPIDVSYFFGEEADSVCVNPTLYPDIAEMDRCAMEHDWGSETPKLIELWSRVKGENANALTIIVIAVVIAAILGFAVYNRHFSRKARTRRGSRKRK